MPIIRLFTIAWTWRHAAKSTSMIFQGSQFMDKVYFQLWAKTADQGTPSWHPLILHLLDVAACADAILRREPEKTRQRIAEVLGLPLEEANHWILLLVACHDLGKASPGFQLKWDGAKVLLADSGLEIPSNADTGFNHAFLSQIALAELLQEQGWQQDLAELCADAVGCHHGARAGPRRPAIGSREPEREGPGILGRCSPGNIRGSPSGIRGKRRPA